MLDTALGPSGGVLGEKDSGLRADARLVDNAPDLARKLLTWGKKPRAGHDPARWDGVDWSEYSAKVGVPARVGKWAILPVDSREGTTSDTIHRWVAEAECLPWQPGVYTILQHDDRGLVMSDVPGEIAGALPFLDHVAALDEPSVLIAGLGLGIVPAWLLANTTVARVDVIEIDADLIKLTTSAARSCTDPGTSWADNPRLRIHHADAHTWQPGSARYAAGWLDIWDLVSAANLPSMDQLEAHLGPLCHRVWSWERAECEAKWARGETERFPNCFVDETGYPHMDDQLEASAGG